MRRVLIAGAVFAIQLALCQAAAAGPSVFATYGGSYQGVTERDNSLNQQTYITTPVTATGIALNVSGGDIYLTSGDQIFEYGYGGGLIRSYSYGDPGLTYTGVAFSNGDIYAAYTGSYQGVSERDASLNQYNYFATGVNATGIAAGPAGQLYLTAGDTILDYSTSGALVNSFNYGDPALLYTGVAYGDGMVLASYTGSYQGVTERDLALNQTSYFLTGFQINGIAAGTHNDVLLVSGDSIYDYSLGGQLLNQFTYGDPGLTYTAIAAGVVPEPATWAMLLLGVGMIGLAARRRTAGRPLTA